MGRPRLLRRSQAEEHTWESRLLGRSRKVTEEVGTSRECSLPDPGRTESPNKDGVGLRWKRFSDVIVLWRLKSWS